ncbi:PucR family transcriptional regulator [Bacillus sp. ISL-37]|uniref:helix-turn-helix domain-containing protein n=1 Tax=Bacillus sp. ISL-37 TaxID=2819123 RepID=UPI001BEB8E8E|nr:PucR family transcriptional regulator [Bacillus sp. ISL-37]MBT2682226.1 helix-turn-helix domain-containing protein [Bacillus sp. ISL-37]
MITVKEFSRELEKENIVLVSGKQNEGLKISYITSLELTEKTSRVKAEGFVMSTFHAFKNETQIINYIGWLKEVGISALGFHTASRKGIPKEVLEFTNTNAIPLFEIPEEIPYYTIIEIYNSMVNKREKEQAAKLYKLNEKLMEIVLLEKDLNSIVKVIGDHINNVVCVLDPYFELIAYWKAEGQTRKDIKRLIDSVINQHKENLLKVRFTNRDTTIILNNEISLSGEFKVFPLFSKQNFMGYILISQNEITDKYSEDVIKNGIRALSLAAHNKNTMLDFQKNKDFKLFESIFNKESVDISHSDFYMDLKKVKSVFQVQVSSPEAINSLLQMFSELLLGDEVNSRIWIYDRKIVGVINTSIDEEKITSLLKTFPDLRIGVSLLEGIQNVKDIKTMYDQSSIALAHSKFHNVPIIFWHTLGIEKVSYSILSHQLYENFDEEVLGPLISFDKEKNANLTDTLYVYLKHFFNLQKSSTELFIHPNTVKYRLQKINELLGMELHDSSNYSMLMMAFSIHFFKKKENL